MCGIAGIFDSQSSPTRRDIGEMVRIQRHRGPDASGIVLDGAMAMGMARLAIIDLQGGDQPMCSPDGSLAVVFNGEIYNYIELREDLMSRGYQFRTRSDTEVLLHMYTEHGAGMLPHLNGMFAFAIWDAKLQTVLVARDRMGVKPLYYAQSGSRWFFASELKCLLTQSEVSTALDLDALADFLRLGYIPRQWTPYANVHKLLPGHYLMLDPDGHRVARWWDLAEQQQSASETSRERQRADLVEKFDDAVRLRMRSDVPVASFLSGGLDSSLVTVTAQRASEIPLNTFTLAFEHTEFDETPYARAVAEQANTWHRERIASPRHAIDHLPLLLWHMDEPMGDSSIIPNFLISKFAAENVKVCLSGLGGDELFGGYSRYLDPGKGRIRRAFEKIPMAAGALAPAIQPWRFSWAEELRMASNPSMEWRGYLHRLQIFDSCALKAIGFPSMGRGESIIEDLWNRFPGVDPVSRRQFIDQHTYLPDEILALTDRMSMANSLEVRTPFMDYRLVRFAQTLTSPMKQTSQHFKIFLKESLGDRVPPEILNRPKWGFDTPLKRWLAQPEMLDLIRQLPSGECVKEGLLRASAVAALVATPESVCNSARRVWNLLVLDTWLRIRGRMSPPQESLNSLMEPETCSVL